MQFIQVYKNVFNDDFCKQAIDYFNLAEEGGLTRNRQEENDQFKKLDKADAATFIPSFPMQHASQELLNEFHRVFWGTCYKQYSDKFDILKTFAEHKAYTMKIQKTKPGEGYHMWHSEVGGRFDCQRLLTWTIYLNDDFEAGETEFLYQQHRYKPSKGDMVIFPTGFTHTHRGNPPIGGDKYIITGWVEF